MPVDSDLRSQRALFMGMRYGWAMIEIVTRSGKETKKVAGMLAREVSPQPRGAAVVALQGELGAGKTTFTQGFARALGVRENVLSPTFVLMKIYALKHKSGIRKQGFRHFVHIDCYRITSPKDMLHLGWKDLCKDKDAIILIEWPERIRKLLPKTALHIRFLHDKGDKRVLEIR